MPALVSPTSNHRRRRHRAAQRAGTQVLRLASKGLANKQIGRALGITERTVTVYLTNIYRRIGVTDRTSAALWARNHLGEQAPQ
jgi:DNA-binding NarL/FixJ family response regulator